MFVAWWNITNDTMSTPTFQSGQRKDCVWQMSRLAQQAKLSSKQSRANTTDIKVASKTPTDLETEMNPQEGTTCEISQKTRLNCVLQQVAQNPFLLKPHQHFLRLPFYTLVLGCDTRIKCDVYNSFWNWKVFPNRREVIEVKREWRFHFCSYQRPSPVGFILTISRGLQICWCSVGDFDDNGVYSTSFRWKFDMLSKVACPSNSFFPWPRLNRSPSTS